MTQDEIIEMAQECRLIGMRPHLDGIYIESLLAFAKLVEEKALAEHAMQEVQRLGQEIEQEPVADYIAARDMLDAQPVPPRTWVGLTDDEKNDCLVSADPCEALAEPEARQLIEDVEQALKERNQ